MSNKYLTTYFICEKCQKKHEFSDDKNTPGVRLIRCQHFILKFIRNTDENYLSYFVSVKCRGCSTKQDIKNINLTLNYNKNEKDLKYNKFSCCQNAIIIGAFYSEVELDTISKMINLSDYNDFRHDNFNYDRDEQKRNSRDLNNLNNLNINQSHNQMNNNNMFQLKESTLFNKNQINNNRYLADEINNNGYYNMEQKELNNFKGSSGNKASFDKFNNMAMHDYFMLMNINNIPMNNNNIQVKNRMEMDNNFMQINKNMNNNMINNNINNNNMNNNMMNNNMNNNMMNNNNIMGNNMMNNNIMNNNVNNNMMNNNMNDNLIINNNFANNNMRNSQNEFNNNYKGKIINFKLLVFSQKYYPMQERNDKLFGEVLKEFLDNHPEIQKSIHKDQKYACGGKVVSINKSLFENGIKDNSIVIIPFIKTQIFN